MVEVKNCLISVYNKDGVLKFASELSKLGVRIYATDGTAKHLLAGGVKVIPISKITGFDKLLDGNIKTLHPGIFKRILATEKEAKKLKTKRFEMLVVNLYPPEKEPDIGGVSLIRAGIKRWNETVVVVDPQDYGVVENGLKQERGVDDKIRDELNKKAAIYVLKYQIENYRKYYGWELLPYLIEIKKELRYGTNPSRKGFVGSELPTYSFDVLKGEISYNNVYDADSALRCALALQRIFKKPSVCIVKHGSPCGASVADDQSEAIRRAWESDPISAYGGVIALPFKIKYPSAEQLKGKFFDVIVMLDSDAESQMVIYNKNAKIIKVGKEAIDSTEKIMEIRSALGSYIIEIYSDNEEDIQSHNFKPAYTFDFSDSDIRELEFSYTVARFVKSNAVVVSSGFQTLGVGGGSTSRIDATKFALMKTKEFLKRQEERVEKFYISSDGFFPFPDSIETIYEEIRSVVPDSEIFVAQPGGSIRDEEVIKVAEKLGVKMFITGKRCFRH